MVLNGLFCTLYVQILLIVKRGRKTDHKVWGMKKNKERISSSTSLVSQWYFNEKKKLQW